MSAQFHIVTIDDSYYTIELLYVPPTITLKFVFVNVKDG
jgi:hypothetical protein